MLEGNSLQQPESTASVRTLKIEADGDHWKGPIKPKIRLMGQWLERAGFKPGSRVRVACVAPGFIELRASNALPATNGGQPPPEQGEHSP